MKFRHSTTPKMPQNFCRNFSGMEVTFGTCATRNQILSKIIPPLFPGSNIFTFLVNSISKKICSRRAFASLKSSLLVRSPSFPLPMNDVVVVSVAMMFLCSFVRWDRTERERNERRGEQSSSVEQSCHDAPPDDTQRASFVPLLQ